MGSLTDKVPTSILHKFKDTHRVLIEGGTYKGQSSYHASTIMDKVITIERDEKLYNSAKMLLSTCSNVMCILGHSVDAISNLKDLKCNVIWWLDSHWSSGDTAGEDDECPLLRELELVFTRNDRDDIILIDDARMFLHQVTGVHKQEHWPSFYEIVEMIPDTYNHRVQDDIIIIYPVKYKENI